MKIKTWSNTTGEAREPRRQISDRFSLFVEFSWLMPPCTRHMACSTFGTSCPCFIGCYSNWCLQSDAVTNSRGSGQRHPLRGTLFCGLEHDFRRFSHVFQPHAAPATPRTVPSLAHVGSVFIACAEPLVGGCCLLPCNPNPMSIPTGHHA